MKNLEKMHNSFWKATLLILAFALPSYAQANTDYPQMEKLISVLDQISEKYQVIFSYETELLRSVEVDFTLREESLESAIDRLLSSAGFEYESIGDKYFVIYKNNQRGNRTKRKLSQKIKQIQKIENQGSLRLESYSPKKLDRMRSLIQVVSELRDIEVSGRVTSDDGMPLIGVSVTVANTSTGTSTDIDGYYTLAVPEDTKSLLFSYIGFETVEVNIGGRTTIDLVMQADLAELSEVVVIGYGAVRKQDLTGAVVSLRADDMTTGAAVTSAASMLQGRAAGVEVSANDGEPGQGMNILIRGTTSISNSNQPLYVVDGFPLAAGVSISPEDIESIDILKDASASAIYGSRGSSGVVLITTKKGKTGKTEISMDGYTGLQSITGTVDYLDWQDNARIVNEQYAQGPNDGMPWYNAADLALNNNTDWVDEATREASINNFTLRASGGDKVSHFSLSANYFLQEGLFLNSEFERTSVRLNADRSFGDKTKVGMNIYVSRINSDALDKRPGSRTTSPLYASLGASPGRAAYNADGTLASSSFSRDTRPFVNPLGHFTERTNDYNEWRTYSNLFVDHNILENLVARINVGFDNTSGNSAEFQPAPYSILSTDDYAIISESKNTSYLMEGTLNYNLNISDRQTFSILGGASTQKDEYSFFNAEGSVFPTDKTLYHNIGSAKNQTIGSFKSDERLISFFGRANYNFDEKYLLSATLRADGASKFGKNNKWGTFPSVSAAWRIMQEDFLSDVEVISDLKARVSYGITGNNNFSPYTSLERVGTGKTITFDGNSSAVGLGTSGEFAPNPELKWETTKMLNFGLDFGFFSNRLFGSFEIYSSNTEDLIIDKPISSPSTGFSIIRSNVGAIHNRGVELTLGGHVATGTNFKWSISANLSTNDNEITELDGDNPIVLSIARQPYGEIGEHAYRQLITGGRMGDFFGYTYRGVLQPGETYSPQPNTTAPGSALYEDINGDGIIDNKDRSVIGNANPDFIWGFNNHFEFKGLYFDLFWQGVVGNEIFNFKAIAADQTLSVRAADRYSPTNPEGTRPGVDYFANEYGSYVNTEFIENGSYVRLKNVALGYNFDLAHLKWISNLHIYVQGQNLLTITDYTGFDPETSFNYSGSQSSVNRGVDDYGFPNYKTYTAGIKVTF